ELETPELLVDGVSIGGRAGLVPSPALVLGSLLVTLAAGAFALVIGASPAAATAAAAVVGAAVNVALRLGPLSTATALPRLGPAAPLAGPLSPLVLRRPGAGRRDRVRLALLVAAGVAVHGALAFFPDHAPPDLDIHVRRTLDLERVPLDYQALLRYGSQLPTESQDQGAATAALGS